MHSLETIAENNARAEKKELLGVTIETVEEFLLWEEDRCSMTYGVLDFSTREAIKRLVIQAKEAL